MSDLRVRRTTLGLQSWRFGGDCLDDERLLAEAARLEEVRRRSINQWPPGAEYIRVHATGHLLRQGSCSLAIFLAWPACCHDTWNAYGGTKVGPRTALCKADYDCPAGLAVRGSMLLAQKRFAGEDTKLASRPDRLGAENAMRKGI